MKSFLSFLLVLCLATTVFSAEPLEKLPPLYTNCLFPTLMVSDAEQNCGGSGFVVRSDKIANCFRNVAITAHHLIKNTTHVFVVIYDDAGKIKRYKRYPMRLYASDERTDLAIVLFESKEQMPVASLDFDAKITLGTDIFHVGFGMFDDARLDYGQVTQPKTRKPAMFSGTIRTNAYTIRGDSGGPLFLKENFKVIGVCQAIRGVHFQMLPNQSYYSPIVDLKSWDHKTNNALSFVYKPAEKMPVLPFVQIKMGHYTLQENHEDVHGKPALH